MRRAAILLLLCATKAFGSPCVEDAWVGASLDGAPSPRASHTAIWTGSVMVVWGGHDGNGYLDTGGRYDPATDTWTATSLAGAPSARSHHTAVWTGSEMLVWGGVGYDGTYRYFNTGARYDPVTDTWTAMATAPAPSGRVFHSALWTGSAMVVWGGLDTHAVLGTGGRYDPATNTWTATSLVGAPSARGGHTVVWTGSAMVVWGGGTDEFPYYLDSGGRYDPATNTWTATSLVGAPSQRDQHTALWTGSAMLVWGGYAGGHLETGGRYDPTTDTWTAMAFIPAPSARGFHTVVWTGSAMVVWGGDGGGYPYVLDTGGRYAPGADTWTATAIAGAPSARVEHTALWTGSAMVVWGGSDGLGPLDTGGRYSIVVSEDDDGGAALCDDLDLCTTDACQGASACLHVPAPGVACDDGNACTTGDACSELGRCVGGLPLDCDDLNACTADACGPVTGCGHTPVSCSRVDFAPPTSEVPAGFVRDDGSTFSPARGSGWTAGVGTRARNSAHPLALDTFAFSQVERTFVLEVQNGNHEACLAAGDPSYEQGPQRIKTNGVTLIDDVSTLANQFASSCRGIPVRNGRLQVAIGGTSGNTLINYLETALVSGGSSFFRSISFQPSGSSPATGFLTDSGEVFDPARGYGWDVPLQSRERNRPVPQVLDTFVFSSAARTWELSVPDGSYDVWYGLGDTDYSEGPHRLVVEGIPVIENASTAAGTFIEGKTDAHVLDGRLTVQIGQGGGAVTTLNYVVVAPRDTDGDGEPDDRDACPFVQDPGQEDADFDRVGSVCDNCSFDFNPAQSDADHDGLGDACDPDDGSILQFAVDRRRIAWRQEVGPTSWNVYEGDLDVLVATGAYTQPPGSSALAQRHCGLLTTWVESRADPSPGKTAFSLVTGVLDGAEGSLGRDSQGNERPNTRPCP